MLTAIEFSKKPGIKCLAQGLVGSVASVIQVSGTNQDQTVTFLAVSIPFFPTSGDNDLQRPIMIFKCPWLC